MRSLPETGERSASHESAALRCRHCGDIVRLPVHARGEAGAGAAVFCCEGCHTVYEMLREHGLCDYYTIAPRPGMQPAAAGRYEFLDDDAVRNSLLDFASDTVCAVTLSIPSIHCSSCIWLLEHLYRLDRGVTHARVDFLKKNVAIRYAPAVTSLRAVVELLASLGYAPALEPGPKDAGAQRGGDERALYYRIGIAGFCFGNIMLLSFPEYLSTGIVDEGLRKIFSDVSLALALPVVFYCASGWFASAYRGLSRKTVTLDVPIALGIAVVFLRSLAAVASGTGAIFLDSLAGLVFFLLLGRLFQAKTYDRLNFERTYRSYFPIGVTVVKDGAETTVPLERLAVGDTIRVRSGEIVPADAWLRAGQASIDYSFVTGESSPVAMQAGELIYAGGRQTRGTIEVRVARDVSQSYLTQLWNADTSDGKKRSASGAVADTVSRYFTAAVLALAALAGAWWMPDDPARALNAATGVLIIACPCALALSVPFTFGTAMRLLGRARCYVKNAAVIESLAAVDTIVFDKTGTLASADRATVHFVGDTLALHDEALVASLACQSAHPLSRTISASLAQVPRLDAADFREAAGEGIEGNVDGVCVRLGTAEFAWGSEEEASPSETRVYASIGGVPKGYFAVEARFRPETGAILAALGGRYALSLVSGDNDSERDALEAQYGGFESMLFFQSPTDKCARVQALQAEGRRVMMVGDGLNDAGALRQSDAGIAVAEDAGMFAPACDVILEAAHLARLPQVLSFARASVRVVHLSFAFSFVYNLFGLAYAVQGALSPVLAAVLMPLSSVTVALFATVATRRAALKRGL